MAFEAEFSLWTFTHSFLNLWPSRMEGRVEMQEWVLGMFTWEEVLPSASQLYKLTAAATLNVSRVFTGMFPDQECHMGSHCCFLLSTLALSGSRLPPHNFLLHVPPAFTSSRIALPVYISLNKVLFLPLLCPEVHLSSLEH